MEVMGELRTLSWIMKGKVLVSSCFVKGHWEINNRPLGVVVWLKRD
jgi:hypothetical protein